MTQLESSHTQPSGNPIDVCEEVASQNEWPYDRQGDDELTVGVEGTWCDYQLWFSWREEIGALQFSCAFEFKIGDVRRRDLHSLIVLVNEKMLIGHFDLWNNEGMLVFRQSQLTKNGATITSELVDDLVELALSECERFYPAFQYVIWGGKTPQEAVELAMLETVGEA